MSKQNKGILCVLLAATAFSLGGLLIKLIPYSSFSIASGRCIFSSLVFALYFIINKRRLVINKTTLFGALFGLLNMLAYIVSNKLTTAANAIILEYTSSIFIIIFEFILFNRKPTKLDIICSSFIFIGIVLVFIDGINTNGLLGIIIALVGGGIYAIVLMANSFEGSDPVSSMFMAHIACAVLFLPFLLKETDFSARTLTYLSILGIVQAGCGYLLLTIGTTLCKPLTVSLLASIEPILNPILVAVFYGEHMNPIAIVGATIVLGSNIVYNILQSR